MAERDLEEELRAAVQEAGAGAETLEPVALLRRLGVTLPPTLPSDLTDLSIPPISLPDRETREAPRARAAGAQPLRLDVWKAPEYIGFAPTLDLEDLDAEPSQPPDAVRRERIGRYEVVGELGVGGMGRVLEVVDKDLGRTLAIKVVRHAARLTEDRLARFVAEAQLTAQLEHPHIVPIHELGVTGGGELYYAMKKVDGVSLAEVLGRLRDGDEVTTRRWTRRRLLGAFVKVCQAAGYAHRRGVVHRDLKPENIMLGEFGEVLLLDWGLARVLDARDESDASGVDAATGTPGYLSPEQARGARSALGPPSDVWSLGAVLYELLTLTRPLQATSVRDYLDRVGVDVIEDPRRRAPDGRIGEDLARICLQALDNDPAQRFRDARELARAVESWLEGARRRREAQTRVRQAGEHWADFRAATEQLGSLDGRIRTLEKDTASWTPVAQKRELLDARAERKGLRLHRAEAFAAAVEAGERALAHDPDNARARAFLARAWWDRMLEAERAGDEVDQRFYERRVRQYDDGPLQALLIGDGAVSLRTDPPATVVAERYALQGLRLALVDRTELGSTPLDHAPLPMGSWRLTLSSPGRPDVIYPVALPRASHWDASREALPLPAEVPEGFVYVPAGPAMFGDDPGANRALPTGRRAVAGFFIAELPVTMGEYLAFLNALAAEDPDAAWARVPRREAGLDGHAERYLARPEAGEAYRLPDVDADGDAWREDFPVFAISVRDAEAYAAWRTEVTGRAHRLPTELEWAKAARGVDGRVFPWGSVEEATLCAIRDGIPGAPQPRPVGSCPDDVSPYGVRDVAGGITEWTATGDERRAVRGGSWASTLRQARLAGRFEEPAARCRTYLGFRLVLDLES